jgi:hypothetical protein
MNRAHRKVQQSWKADLSLGGLFSPSFGHACQAWDSAVAAYILHRKRGSENGESRSAAFKVLRREGVAVSNHELYVDSIERFAAFLGRYAFLYRKRRPGLEPPRP